MMDRIIEHIVAFGFAIMIAYLVSRLFHSLSRKIGDAIFSVEVRVRIHKAYMVVEPDVEYYFINVTNLSEHMICITHVNLGTVPVINENRPLPRVVKAGESWETWVNAIEVEAKLRSMDLWTAGRVHLADGGILKSKKAHNVPETGAIPGGN